jgi:hypothetical protein
MTTTSSLVPPDVVSQLNQVLMNLVSNDNNLRSSAEQQLNEQWIAQQPDLLLLSLAQLGRTHEETHVRISLKSFSIYDFLSTWMYLTYLRVSNGSIEPFFFIRVITENRIQAGTKSNLKT